MDVLGSDGVASESLASVGAHGGILLALLLLEDLKPGGKIRKGSVNCGTERRVSKLVEETKPERGEDGEGGQMREGGTEPDSPMSAAVARS